MIIAICNQKGGVGKTTTALNLGVALALRGCSVEVFDLDMQGDCAKFAANLPAELPISVSSLESFDSPRLKKAEAQYVLLDCPPHLGDDSAFALKNANLVIIPVNAESSALEGLERLFKAISAARRTNPTLRHKILITMFDSRANHCHNVVENVRERFGADVLQTQIRRTIKFADADTFRLSINHYAPRSEGAENYRSLAAEVSTKWPA